MSRGLFFQEGLLRGQVCMEQAGEDNPQGKQGQEDGGAGYGVAGDGSHHCAGEKEQQNLKVSQELFPMGRVSSTQTPELMGQPDACLLYTSPSPRDGLLSRMPSSA